MAQLDKAICCQLSWQLIALLLAAAKEEHIAIQLLQLL